MIKVRKAREKDFPRIFIVEKRSYTPQLQAPHAALRSRNKAFGIWVAEHNRRVRGFSTAVPVRLTFNANGIRKVLRNRNPNYKPWFDEYDRGGEFNTLWVTSTAVERSHQRKGIGTSLVLNSLKLAKKMGLKYRASALRCEFGKWHEKTGGTIEEYLEEVRVGVEKDRFLSPYLRLGFTLVAPLPNYEPHKGSLNYNVLAYRKI